MKKIIIFLAMFLAAVLLVSCTTPSDNPADGTKAQGNVPTKDKTYEAASVTSMDLGNVFYFYFAVMENGEVKTDLSGLSAHMKIVNHSGDVLFDGTPSIEILTEGILGNVSCYFDYSGLKATADRTGTVTCTLTVGSVSAEATKEVDSLPFDLSFIEFPTLPCTVNTYTKSGDLLKTVEITDVRTEQRFDGDQLKLRLYFSGSVTFSAENANEYCGMHVTATCGETELVNQNFTKQADGTAVAFMIPVYITLPSEKVTVRIGDYQ